MYHFGLPAALLGDDQTGRMVWRCVCVGDTSNVCSLAESHLITIIYSQVGRGGGCRWCYLLRMKYLCGGVATFRSVDDGKEEKGRRQRPPDETDLC